MRATRVVVVRIFGKERPQTGFIPDNDVIEAFTPYRSDDAFCISVLPGAARRNGSVTNATSFNAPFEFVTEFCVVVTDQEPGCRVPGEGFVDLLSHPHCCRVRCRGYENQVAAVQSDDHEGVKLMIVDGRDSEEIDSSDAVHLAAQKCPPRWAAATRASARHIFRDRRLGDFEAKFEQFAMDARRTPQHIFSGDPLDESNCLAICLGPARQGARLPAPVAAKAPPVQPQKCCRRDQQRQPRLAWPNPIQPYQEQAIRIRQVQTFRSAPSQHEIFVPKPNDLSLDGSSGSKEIADREKYIGEQEQHVGFGGAAKKEMSDRQA